MRIAIIGYGSLIWDLENLTPFVEDDWQLGLGPAMPVEFSRVSPKRKQALVLNIDETLNHECKTSVIASARDDLDLAVNDLAERERCGIEMIGFVSKNGATYRAMQSAADWLDRVDYDAVIWTALPGNFNAKVKQPFSFQNGRDYLKTLDREALKEAWQYIEFAPEVTDTPFRRYLCQDEFWQSLDYGPGPA